MLPIERQLLIVTKGLLRLIYDRFLYAAGEVARPEPIIDETVACVVKQLQELQPNLVGFLVRKLAVRVDVYGP